MKSYELTYLIPPDLSEEKIWGFQEKINSLIQEEKGVLGEINEPARKKMAYLVKNKGWVCLVTSNFYLDPEKLGNLEKKLKSESQILRYMILTKPPKTSKTVISRGRKLPLIKPKKRPIPKPEAKVELKEIDKKIEEILEE